MKIIKKSTKFNKGGAKMELTPLTVTQPIVIEKPTPKSSDYLNKRKLENTNSSLRKQKAKDKYHSNKSLNYLI